MHDDKQPIFIVGYPKSGNTWLTRLVGEARNSPTGSGYLLHDQEIATEGNTRSGRYWVLKSHHSMHDRPDYLKPPILYIVRDLRDVLISGFFHHHRHWNEQKLEFASCRSGHDILRRFYFDWHIRRTIGRWQGPPARALRRFYYLPFAMWSTAQTRSFAPAQDAIGRILAGFVPKRNHSRAVVGNWSDHVRYWMQEPGVAFVRYESLLADAVTELVACFDRLGLTYDTDMLKNAVQNQAFETRKRAFQDTEDHQNYMFLRKGVAGDWKRFLTHSQLQDIHNAHGNTLSLLGYSET